MKVKYENNPNTELILKALEKVDFTDTFATTNHTDSLEVITKKVLGKSPAWVKYLMRLRNFLVRFIGLRVEEPKDLPSTFEPGSYVAFFKIYQIVAGEVILGADDSHLDFRVSILQTDADQYNLKPELCIRASL